MVRVSSAAIRATWPKMRNARRVISSKLPMGVPTTYSVPITISLRGKHTPAPGFCQGMGYT